MLMASIVGGRNSLQMLINVRECVRIHKTFLGLKILWLARAVRVRVPPSASSTIASLNLQNPNTKTWVPPGVVPNALRFILDL